MDKFSRTKLKVHKICADRHREDLEWKKFPAVRMVLFVFRIIYAWPPKGMDRGAAFRYRLKGIAFRIFFIYLSVVAQIAFIFTIQKREEVIEGLFVLSTQLVLILKIEFFYIKVSKVQTLFYQLDDELYASSNAEEDVLLVNARKKTSIGCMLYLTLSDGLILYWIFFCIKLHIPLVPSLYPFDYDSSYPVFVLTILFQGLCLALNAALNIAWDSLVYALLALLNAQLQRLQIQLTKVGHTTKSDSKGWTKVKTNLIAVKPADIRRWKSNHLLPVEVNQQTPDDVYNELLKCVIFHQKLIKFLHELLELFGGMIIIQLYCSVFIICITEFRLLTDVGELGDLSRTLPYLVCIILQVYQFCSHGNEVSYTAQKVHEATAFVNYPDMDIRTRKLLIFFQQRTAAGVNCYAKNVFKIELSNATFVSIIKSSYSFLAVLRSMMD